MNAEKYEEINVPIVVIVAQKRKAVKKWLEKNPMPFPFLIDEDRQIIKAFDVYNPISIDAYKIAHPSMFLISADQKIVYAYVGKNQADRPSDDLTYRHVHGLLSDSLEND